MPSKNALSIALLWSVICLPSCGDSTDSARRNPRGAERPDSGDDGKATERSDDEKKDGSQPDKDGNNEAGSESDDAVNENTKPPGGSGIQYEPVDLPAASGTCPDFVEGQDLTFNPNGVPPRKARVWIGPEAKSKDGPLVFYFQGTGMKPTDATWSIGTNNISEIKSMGGLVVAPYPDQSEEYPWFYANGKNDEDDLLVIDEIVACAIKQVGIDTRRIHATGLSAGGMLSSDISQRRANYFASVSPHSGGFASWNKIHTNAEPRNKMAIMIFHGGASDNWENRLFYKEMSEKNVDLIVNNGGFAMTCDHGLGHRAPKADGADAMWQFFKDHPWNVPSPYKEKLPGDFPAYCKIGK